jgi:hypothetical protein
LAKWAGCSSGDPPEPDPAHGGVDHGHPGLGQALVVARAARARDSRAKVRSISPGRHRRPAWDDLGTLGPLLQAGAPSLALPVLGHFHAPAALGLRLAREPAGVRPVAPDQRHAWPIARLGTGHPRRCGRVSRPRSGRQSRPRGGAACGRRCAWRDRSRAPGRRCRSPARSGQPRGRRWAQGRAPPPCAPRLAGGRACGGRCRRAAGAGIGQYASCGSRQEGPGLSWGKLASPVGSRGPAL